MACGGRAVSCPPPAPRDEQEPGGASLPSAWLLACAGDKHSGTHVFCEQMAPCSHRQRENVYPAPTSVCVYFQRRPTGGDARQERGK